jgi:hypothetical protein
VREAPDPHRDLLALQCRKKGGVQSSAVGLQIDNAANARRTTQGRQQWLTKQMTDEADFKFKDGVFVEDQRTWKTIGW